MLGGAAIAWPTPARPQQAGKLPVIGFLGTSTPSGWASVVTSFVQRLRELGWVDGRTVSIEYRWAGGLEDRYQELAAELVRLKVDVIVTSGGAVPAAKQATSAIPIVFAVANDPLGTGLVASLARPGGNVTGLSVQSTELAGKRLELLREVIPGVRRLAIFGNAGHPAVVLDMREAQAAARTVGLEAVMLEVRKAEEIAAAFDALESRAEALYVCGADPLAAANRIRINTLALTARLPTVHSQKEYLEGGGLM